MTRLRSIKPRVRNHHYRKPVETQRTTVPGEGANPASPSSKNTKKPVAGHPHSRSLAGNPSLSEVLQRENAMEGGEESSAGVASPQRIEHPGTPSLCWVADQNIEGCPLYAKETEDLIAATAGPAQFLDFAMLPMPKSSPSSPESDSEFLCPSDRSAGQSASSSSRSTSPFPLKPGQDPPLAVDRRADSQKVLPNAPRSHYQAVTTSSMRCQEQAMPVPFDQPTSTDIDSSESAQIVGPHCLTGSWTARNPTNPPTSKRSRRGNGRLSDEDDDSSGADRPVKRKQRGKSFSEPRYKFACHFFRRFPRHNMDCVNLRLSRARDVKQHLNRRHAPPILYCPTCYTSFTKIQDRDGHIQARECVPKPTGFDRTSCLSQQALDRLKSRSVSTESQEMQWYAIWNLIFPEVPFPKAGPYLGTPVEEPLWMERDFWQTHLRVTLSSSEEKQMLLNTVRESKSDDAAVEALLQIMNSVQDSFKAGIRETAGTADETFREGLPPTPVSDPKVTVGGSDQDNTDPLLATTRLAAHPVSSEFSWPDWIAEMQPNEDADVLLFPDDFTTKT